MNYCIALITQAPLQIRERINFFLQKGYRDILIIDDGHAIAYVREDKELEKKIVLLQHDKQRGYGSCLTEAFEYCISHDYDALITINPEVMDYLPLVEDISNELSYGYDLVKGSRILENYNHDKLDTTAVDTTVLLAELLKEYINKDITDPLSPVAGYSGNLMKQVEQVDHTTAVHLQLLLQAHYLDLTIHEIPLGTGQDFGMELDELEMEGAELKQFMEAEMYLYKKGTIN